MAWDIKRETMMKEEASEWMIDENYYLSVSVEREKSGIVDCIVC
jgi:hypothetical protein